MARIIIVSDDPITSRIMAYVSIDSSREVKLKYADSPYEHHINPGTHSFFISTSSPLQRNLASAGDGDFISTVSNMLNDVESGTWNGTVTLEEEDVLLIYIEVKITKSVIHFNVTDNEEADRFLEKVRSERSTAKSKRVTPWKVIKTVFCIMICLAVIYPAVEKLLDPRQSKSQENDALQAAADTSYQWTDTSAPTESTDAASSDDVPDTTGEPSETAGSTVMLVDANIGLNLRAEPDINAEALAIMPYKNPIVVYEIRGEWARVKFGDTEGWCASRYLYSENSSKGISVESVDLHKSNSLSSEIVISIDSGKKVTVISEDGEWLYVKCNLYDRGTVEAGWCERSKIQIAPEFVPVFTGELTEEVAQKLINTYQQACAFPYHVFMEMGILNIDDKYNITWDDGSVAAISYTANGISTADDFRNFYRNFCTEKIISEKIIVDNDHSNGYMIVDGKYYFHPNYAMGFYLDRVESISFSDDVYEVQTVCDYFGTATYKIVFEDGKYKIDEITAYQAQN